jgi:hypothetical protein
MILPDVSLNVIKEPLLIAYIDNVLSENSLKDIDVEIETIEWPRLFDRAGSYMLECNNITRYTQLRKLYFECSSSKFIEQLEQITGINYLIPDPHMIGAGYSQIKDSGDLKPHIDFNWNDRLKLYRACTVMIYLTTPESGGEIEFIDVVKLPVKRNRVVIFNHSESIRHFVHPVVGVRNAVRFFYYTSNVSTPSTRHKSLYGIKEDIPCDI